jgi:hypothetical protein
MPRYFFHLESREERIADRRGAGLAGVSRRQFVDTTVKGGGRQAADLADRNFGGEAAVGGRHHPDDRCIDRAN